jgi:hypothetical protein
VSWQLVHGSGCSSSYLRKGDQNREFVLSEVDTDLFSKDVNVGLEYLGIVYQQALEVRDEPVKILTTK